MASEGSYKAAIVTVSDSSFYEKQPDRSGEDLEKALLKTPFSRVVRSLVPDERDQIAQLLKSLSKEVDLILTTGGTGVSPRDVTPEATHDVIEKEIPGFGEQMRRESLKKTPHAILSRATGGVCGRCIILNLPGSPKGAVECLDAVIQALPHAVDVVQRRIDQCDPKSRKGP